MRIIKSLEIQDMPDRYTNLITELLDRLLKPNYKKMVDEGYSFSNYMMTHDKEVIVIRFPGATRGHIKLDKDNVILEIEFYPETMECYLIDPTDNLKHFVGDKLILKEADDK